MATFHSYYDTSTSCRYGNDLTFITNWSCDDNLNVIAGNSPQIKKEVYFDPKNLII